MICYRVTRNLTSLFCYDFFFFCCFVCFCRWMLPHSSLGIEHVCRCDLRASLSVIRLWRQTFSSWFLSSAAFNGFSLALVRPSCQLLGRCFHLHMDLVICNSCLYSPLNTLPWLCVNSFVETLWIIFITVVALLTFPAVVFIIHVYHSQL